MCPPALPSPAGKGSLVQRELSRPKTATEGLSEVAGYLGMISATIPTPSSHPRRRRSALRRWPGWLRQPSFPFVGADAHIGPLLGTAIDR